MAKVCSASVETLSTDRPKALRIGVVQAGRILEERLVLPGDKVSIGSSPRNTLSLAASSLPRSFTLFTAGRGGYRLCFASSMDGRISTERGVRTLQEVASGGLARSRGGLMELPLDPCSRGKVRLGEVSVLFQFVTAPPSRPRPRLPASIEGGVFSRLDWVLASCLATMAVLHFGFLMVLKTVDLIQPQASLVKDITPYLPIVKDPYLPIPKIVDPTQIGEEPVKPVAKIPKPSRIKDRSTTRPRPAKPCDQACKLARAERERALLAKIVSKIGVPRILANNGKDGKGSAVANLIRGGVPDTALAEALKNVKVQTHSRTPGGLHANMRGNTGPGLRVHKIEHLGDRWQGPEKVAVRGTVVERVPTPLVRPQRKELEPGDLPADSTYRTIRRGLSCIKLKYSRALKQDHKISGKVQVCLTINTAGRVAAVDIHSDLDSPFMDAGIRACAQRWRFAPPLGGSTEVCVPFVLKPSTN